MSLPERAVCAPAPDASADEPIGQRNASVRVAEMSVEDSAAWDCYVADAGGLPTQLAGWSAVIASSFGVDPAFLYAAQSGRIVGVLPMYFLHSRIVGCVARSMPGGLCAGDRFVADALIAAAVERARDAGMVRLELHDARVTWPGMADSSDYVAWRVDLSAGPTCVLEQLDRNVRRQIKIAERNGLDAVIDRDGRDIGAFYEVVRRSMHAQGTPVFPLGFFERVWAAFPDRCAILVVRHAGRPVAGFFQMEAGAGVYGLWGGSLPEARDSRAGYLGCSEIIRDAADRGLAFLDMGRSPRTSGASEFKAQWGGQAAPVFQQALDLVGGGEVASPAAPGAAYHGLARWWRRLPLGVACALGPQARRHFPFG